MYAYYHLTFRSAVQDFLKNLVLQNTPPGASTLSISSIAVDSFNSSIAYAITNTAPDGAPRIYTTTNQGVSWSQITTIGLPLSGINIIKINPINKILYAGMDHGVYYSADNGVHWTKVGSGLPNVAVDDLAFTKDNALIAATHGRGVWKYFITPVVTLKNVINTGIYKSGIIIALAISSTTGISQVLYHWDNLANSTFSTLYNVTLPTGDGPHNLTVFVQDTNGVWIKQSFTFLADNIPPSIIITTPANGTTILLTTIINGTVTDLDGIVLLDYHWDNFGNTTIRSLSSIIIPNLSGQHILSIYAQDNAGNWAKAKYTYVIGSISSTPGYDVLVFGISLVCMALVLLFKRRNK